jgi:2-polyprenyl-3-methyl-5-hydroxy-6-metoxy-1,4-benzoquinol methylase
VRTRRDCDVPGTDQSRVRQRTDPLIRTLAIQKCPVCGSTGQRIYDGLRDQLFGAPGMWGFQQCSSERCGLMWLDPMPVESDISTAYANYYTHGPAEIKGRFKRVALALWRRRVTPVLSLLSPLHRDRKRLSVMYLDSGKVGRVLDVGCGGGERLAKLREMGWEVYGQDIDSEAAAHARTRFQIDVRVGPLENSGFQNDFFDSVVMNHVIEHVHDSEALLRKCKALLKPGGELIVVTPNSRSVTHRYFGSCWRGLEPPRHILIFTEGSLRRVAEKAGLAVVRLRTTCANAFTVAFFSAQLKRNNLPLSRVWRLGRFAFSVGFQYYSVMRSVADPSLGDELVAHLSK